VHLPHVHEHNATQNMRMTEEKHVLVLNAVLIYSFSSTCTSITLSSRRLLLFSLSVSIFKKRDNVHTYTVTLRCLRATIVAVDKQ